MLIIHLKSLEITHINTHNLRANPLGCLNLIRCVRLNKSVHPQQLR